MSGGRGRYVAASLPERSNASFHAEIPQGSKPLPDFTKTDRLGVSTFASLLVHMIIILGVTFAAPKLRQLDGLPTLEITLVQTQSAAAPKNTEFLAQANQDGGGDSDKPDIARNPLPLTEISDTRRDMPATRSVPQRKVASTREITDMLSRESKEALKLREPRPENRELQPVPPKLGVLDPQEVLEERARLNAEISRFWQEYQKRPKHRFLNARTREYRYAAYMDAWRAKVERIGNLNYPEEARRRHISGNLVVDVALNPDGSLKDVTVRRSSGHKLLDDAAVRIVELAAPFAPFPPDIRAETDVLHITRTWKFNEVLSAEN